jgi:hypothetical protein
VPSLACAPDGRLMGAAGAGHLPRSEPRRAGHGIGDWAGRSEQPAALDRRQRARRSGHRLPRFAVWPLQRRALGKPVRRFPGEPHRPALPEPHPGPDRPSHRAHHHHRARQREPVQRVLAMERRRRRYRAGMPVAAAHDHLPARHRRLRLPGAVHHRRNRPIGLRRGRQPPPAAVSNHRIARLHLARHDMQVGADYRRVPRHPPRRHAGAGRDCR